MGKLWKLDKTERVLQPGEVMCWRASVKLNWDQPSSYIILEGDPQSDDSGLELFTEVVSMKALWRTHGKVPVSVCNISDSPIKLRARMMIGQMNPATPLPMMPEWNEQAKAQLVESVLQ